MKRFFYFRDEAASGDDDDVNASILVPIDDITGMNAQAATKLDIFFKSQTSIESGAEGNVVVMDSVRLTVTTETQKGVMKAIAEAMNHGPHVKGITVIADDQLSVYLVPEITACDITVAAAEE
tara:strand:+ start:73 stop:441 length:369 start_codon:yes stop_codon:yes gene_type:complete